MEQSGTCGWPAPRTWRSCSWLRGAGLGCILLVPPDEEEEKEEAPEDFFWSSSSPRLATFLCSSATSSSSPLCSLCSHSTCGHSCCAAETGTHCATFSVLVQFWLVMLVTMHLGCVPLGCRRPRSSTSWPVWTRRAVGSLRFFLVTMPLALCSSWFSSGPGCSTSWPIWTKRKVTQFLLVTMPLTLFRRDSTGAVLGQFLGLLCATTGALVQGQFLDRC